MKRILFIKKDQKDIDSLDDLNNKKVAVTITDDKIMNIKKHHSNIKVIKTDTIKKSITMLLTEKVDALIASPIIIQKYLEQNLIINLKAVPSISFEPSNLYFLINKNKPILESIIKKGLNSISIKEKKRTF